MTHKTSQATETPEADTFVGAVFGAIGRGDDLLWEAIRDEGRYQHRVNVKRMKWEHRLRLHVIGLWFAVGLLACAVVLVGVLALS